MFFTGRLSLCFVAVSAAAAGEREAERVDGVQREVQGALRVAHQHGEQGLAERRHQHWGDDREAPQGRKRCTLSNFFTTVGAPQGCVSSPVLFTLSTDTCRSFNPNNHVIKFWDDTAVLSLTTLWKLGFVNWCNDNHLVLNINKTEEIVFEGTTGLWSSTTKPLLSCSHTNILVSLLTAHSPAAHTWTASLQTTTAAAFLSLSENARCWSKKKNRIFMGLSYRVQLDTVSQLGLETHLF